MKRFSTALYGIAIGLAAGFTPAMAQTLDDEVVVTGPFSEDSGGVMHYRTSVNYADLDLATASGRAELRDRVAMTARGVCSQLRFRNDGPVMNNDCYQSAMRSAMAQVEAAEDGYAP
jgi:UrcA family protein